MSPPRIKTAERVATQLTSASSAIPCPSTAKYNDQQNAAKNIRSRSKISKAQSEQMFSGLPQADLRCLFMSTRPGHRFVLLAGPRWTVDRDRSPRHRLVKTIEGHLEKFFSPSRYESDSLTAMGHGRIERASHGADGLFR